MTSHFQLAAIFCLIAGVFTSAPVKAQSIDDTGLWLVYLDSGNADRIGLPGERLKYWFDAQARFLDDADGYAQSLIRPGLGWSVSEDAAVWGGYAWVHTEPVSGNAFVEDRLWQQWTWNPSRDDVAFAMRSRFEQRWVETGDDVGLRWRQLWRGQKTIAAAPQFSLIGWNEVFINTNDTDWGARKGLDQNRVFVGFGYNCPHSDWRTEIGYLNQAINRPGGTDSVNHILSLTLVR